MRWGDCLVSLCSVEEVREPGWGVRPVPSQVD
ncbi:hypothetical protein SFR_0525 [Streptomyces sp. FR-008]|nr:hypothetical protein SFR_0525 [Streptomyces sp. FR-008]